MIDQGRKHPHHLFSMSLSDEQLEEINNRFRTHDPIRDLSWAIAYLNDPGLWRGAPGSRHIYINSRGEKTRHVEPKKKA